MWETARVGDPHEPRQFRWYSRGGGEIRNGELFCPSPIRERTFPANTFRRLQKAALFMASLLTACDARDRGLKRGKEKEVTTQELHYFTTLVTFDVPSPSSSHLLPKVSSPPDLISQKLKPHIHQQSFGNPCKLRAGESMGWVNSKETLFTKSGALESAAGG